LDMSGRITLSVRRAWPLRALCLARTGRLALAIGYPDFSLWD
jgi:hypothetical protein